ncbi:hypothetical protein GCM10007872_18650 [Gluconobacter sphaericus NBRC 12467]|uniref:Uncharacterized protein n=1 Tax=Gluconobacter sphaericus NBRC 12467 TaxID=1307951 RepID=A0AA37SK68_9PROT|nr:hypothetical protein AA12467_1680 [Gluconobacter sphaericus NBRC 12467]GEB42367.1 hypothetical protein GSP01_11490 [Gluconobacter sphaericus NBRC 12467]GLQ84957.1 hypothetical protein GCM10007872_18650 [Gluconobacter sphaericus NBRC 12467]
MNSLREHYFFEPKEAQKSNTRPENANTHAIDRTLQSSDNRSVYIFRKQIDGGNSGDHKKNSNLKE